MFPWKSHLAALLGYKQLTITNNLSRRFRFKSLQTALVAISSGIITIRNKWHADIENSQRPAHQKRIKNMRLKGLSLVFILCALACPLPSTAQGQPSDTDTQAPVLTLDEAVSLALQHNRLVKNSVLEAQKYDFRVHTALSQRKPQFHVSILGGELLNSFNFTIPPQ
jgi:hypothetical protein